tara:strand:+ start:2443 stop:2640 length:198 start_codon:yes stop_codon:yes gene_type:complete
MISDAYKSIYTGCPGDNDAAIFCNQSNPSEVPNQLAIVAGNKIILDAKIGGITPDMFILKGKWVD